jgi:hypothetical protein
VGAENIFGVSAVIAVPFRAPREYRIASYHSNQWGENTWRRFRPLMLEEKPGWISHPQIGCGRLVSAACAAARPGRWRGMWMMKELPV